MATAKQGFWYELRMYFAYQLLKWSIEAMPMGQDKADFVHHVQKFVDWKVSEMERG